MPDITMCRGQGCPVKNRCKRHTSKPDEHYQAYFAESPYKDGECKYFWKDPKFDEKIQTDLSQKFD